MKGNHPRLTHTFEMSIITLKLQGPEILLMLHFHQTFMKDPIQAWLHVLRAQDYVSHST